jgi:hypothetical protein
VDFVGTAAQVLTDMPVGALITSRPLIRLSTAGEGALRGNRFLRRKDVSACRRGPCDGPSAMHGKALENVD